MDLNFLSNNQPSSQASSQEPEATLEMARLNAGGLDLFKYIRVIIYVLIFLAPLFYLPFTSELLEFNKQFLIFVLAGIGLILYLAQVIKNGRLIFKKSPANYGALIYLAAVILVTLFSELKYRSIFGGFDFGFSESLISTASLAVFFFLIFNVFSKESINKILDVFGLSLFLVLSLGLFQILGTSVFGLLGIAGAPSSFNTVGTLNSLGVISAILLVLSFSKLNAGAGSLLRYLKIPSILLPLFFLMLFNWWILWLIAISGLIFVMTINSFTDWRLTNYFWPSAVILLGVVFMLFGFNFASGLAVSFPLEIAPSFKASLNIVKEVFKKDTLFGVGPGNFSVAYDLFKPLSINNTAFWNVRFSRATSEILNIAVEGGAVGLIGFAVLLWAGLRSAFRRGLNRVLRILPAFASLIAAAVLYPSNMTLALSFWLLFGLLALTGSTKDDEIAVNLEKSPRHSLITSVLFVGVMVLAVIGFYFVILRYQANLKFVRAVSAPDVDKQTQLLVEALNLDRNEDTYPRSLNNLLILRIGQEVQKLQQAQTEEERQQIGSRIQNFSATAINLSAEVTARHPKDSVNWFSRGLTYENLVGLINGADEWAIRMYREHAKVAPRDPQPELKIGNIHLNRADSLRRLISGQGAQNITQEARRNIGSQISSNLNQAEENFKKAIELKSNYALAIYNLGAVYERQGRVKDAISQLEATKAVNPLDANLSFQLGLLYYRNNQKNNAFNEIQRALTIFPDFSNARWYLALLYEERGDLDNALAELRKIEALNPDNEILKSKIGELEAGKRSIPPEKVTGVKPLEQGEEESRQ